MTHSERVQHDERLRAIELYLQRLSQAIAHIKAAITLLTLRGVLVVGTKRRSV